MIRHRDKTVLIRRGAEIFTRKTTNGYRSKFGQDFIQQAIGGAVVLRSSSVGAATGLIYALGMIIIWWAPDTSGRDCDNGG